jgi:phosphoglycolate phosphatase-like HAD superfamily hydrolase
VVVIGDTPKDIAAAQAIGAECIAVATGSFKVQALREHGATAAFANLADPAAHLALFG